MELLLGVIVIATAVSAVVLLIGIGLAYHRTRRAAGDPLTPRNGPNID
jgi:hypothetical protein